MRVLKFVGALLVAAASASVLALSGLGAAYAAADDRPVDVDFVDADVHDIYVHDLVNVGDVFAPVTVFAPIHIADVLNDVEILSD